MVELDRACERGEVWMDPACYPGRPAVDALDYPLDELLYNQLLARREGALLHACGRIGRGGEGAIYVAQSGGGKTTLARLIQRHDPDSRVLSAERIAVRRIGADAVMYGTPWHGEGGFAELGQARLARIIFLVHGPVNRLTPVKGIEAAARLYACAYPPVHDPIRVGETLETLARVAASVPAFELAFVPDATVLDLL